MTSHGELPAFAGLLLMLAYLVGLVVAIYGTLVLHIALHEMGHALASRACGFQFSHLRASLATAHQTQYGWIFSVRWQANALLTGEQASLPVHARSLLPRVAMVLAAGPGTNFAVAILLLAAATAYPGRGAPVYVLTGLWIGAAWVGLASFYLNSVAVAGGGRIGTDGRRLYALLRTRSRLDELLDWRHAAPLGSMLSGHAANCSGVTPEELLDRKDRRPVHTYLAGILYAERGDFAAAYRLQESVFASDPEEPFPRDGAQYQLALLEGFCGDPGLGRQRLAWNRDTREATGPHALVQAILLEAEGKRTESLTSLARWRKHMQALGSRSRFFLGNSAWALQELERRHSAPPLVSTQEPGI